MTRRHAILVDGGFLVKRLRGQLDHPPQAADIVAFCEQTARHRLLVDSELLRIFFYDGPPAIGRITNPFDGRSLDLATTPQYFHSRNLHLGLEVAPDFALRMGETVVRGWQVGSETIKDVARHPRPLGPADLRLDIVQKGVDLRIGLDIARLALLRLVDAIVVVTGDRDLVPAFRFARREGLRVYLDHMGSSFVHRDLIAHADRVL